MKVLVTGCAGFVGFYLCKKLLSEGSQVIGIDNLNDDYDVSIKENRVSRLKLFDKFTFIKLDVVNDAFSSILKGEKVDHVIHLAAKDLYYHSPADLSYTEYLITNVIGTSKIFELAKQLESKKFIFLSTHSVYGITKKGLLTERELLPKPISPHGASKIAAEQILHFMCNFYKMPTVILRAFTVYGPEMRPHTLIPLLIDRISKGLPVDLYHDADATRDFIYIDDVVNYILAVMNKRLKFQIINVASGKSFTMSHIAQKIATLVGKDPEKIIHLQHAKSFRHVVVKHVVADTSRAKKLLKYSPQVDIDAGLKTTVGWYLSHPDILHLSTHHGK